MNDHLSVPDPTGPAEAGPAPARRRFPLRVLAGLAAAVVLATVSGLAGGWVAVQIDDDPVGTGGGAGAPSAAFSLAEVVERVQSSVVMIRAGGGEGSGVVLDPDGHILTNHHVVAAAPGGLEVSFRDGVSAAASVVGTDPRSDLAVIRAEDASGLVPAAFGDSDALRIGDRVLALGSPLGLEGSVTSGIVSAKDRTIRVGEAGPGGPGRPGVTSISGMIQTDAAINPGNSGGALVDTTGAVVGINTAIATDGGGRGNIGVGFAIPSNLARSVADRLIAGEEVAHPYLGVSVTDGDGGALVRAVAPAGPAAEAGLAEGDLITEVAGRPVRDADDLVAAVQASEVGARLDITYLRGGAERGATATLGEAPSH